MLTEYQLIMGMQSFIRAFMENWTFLKKGFDPVVELIVH